MLSCQCSRGWRWRQITLWGLLLLCLLCECTHLHLQKEVKWIKADIFLWEVLAFVFVYYVELIVLWAFQASVVCFPSFACLTFYVTGSSVDRQRVSKRSLFSLPLTLLRFKRIQRPHPLSSAHNTQKWQPSLALHSSFQSHWIMLIWHQYFTVMISIQFRSLRLI